MNVPISKPLALACLLAFCWGCGPTAAAADLPADSGQGSYIGESGQPEPDTDPSPEGDAQPEEGNPSPERPEPDADPAPSPEGDAQPGEDGQLPEIGGQQPDLPEGGTEEPEAASYTVTLGQQVVGQDESLSFTTVSTAFSGSAPEGYYPGNLTVELTGQVVVEAGGFLSVGTLSIGGPEASPVITGAGSIVVKAGGQLVLTGAILAPQGEGPMIVQETGGSVETVAVTAEDGLIQWASPLVCNLYDSPEQLWLPAGTPLTADLLPTSMYVTLQQQGREDQTEVALSWDLSGYDGRTDGELALAGVFLDEDGQPLPSLRPLELAVGWYTPGTLVVTDAQWKGSTVPTVQLTVPELPEYADVWGETSTDGGDTWISWTDEDVFFIVEVENEGWACIFVLPDDTPRLFRIAAQDTWADPYAYWQSESFQLGPPEDGEDSGGNRGGSTTPDSPDREPEPAPRPDTSTATQPVLGNAIPHPSQPEEQPLEPGQPELSHPSAQPEQTPQAGSGAQQSQPDQESPVSEAPAVRPEHPVQLEGAGHPSSQAQTQPLPTVPDPAGEADQEETPGQAAGPASPPSDETEPGPAEAGTGTADAPTAPSVPVQAAPAVVLIALCAAAAGWFWTLRRRR